MEIADLPWVLHRLDCQSGTRVPGRRILTDELICGRVEEAQGRAVKTRPTDRRHEWPVIRSGRGL